ncbi:hypothetical protein MIDIC_310042 [Alphaproteobacteria bacterium]
MGYDHVCSALNEIEDFCLNFLHKIDGLTSIPPFVLPGVNAVTNEFVRGLTGVDVDRELRDIGERSGINDGRDADRATEYATREGLFRRW